MHPELSFEEVETAAHVASLLRSFGIEEVFERVGRTGVVAIVRGGAGPGQCIALRADMDALPLPETADVPYKSKNAGKMHACGHDGHMSALLATARVIHARRATMRGAVKFVFQPAEEGHAGAKAMIEDGVLTERVGGPGAGVDAIFGIHLWSMLPVGVVSVREGACMAASDRFDIKVKGKGGHGAAPHSTVDAIVEASHLVLALQTIVSRNRDPLEPAVLSVCMMKGGHGYNIICDEVALCGTVRTFSEDTRSMVIRRMREVCDGVAATFGGSVDFVYDAGYPATVNRCPASVACVKKCGEELVGLDRSGVPFTTCGAEDFSYFLQEKPGAFFFVGAALPGEERPHHKSVFDFDNDAMMVSASMFLQIVDQYLRVEA